MGVAIAKEKLYSNIESSNIEEIDIILGVFLNHYLNIIQ